VLLPERESPGFSHGEEVNSNTPGSTALGDAESRRPLHGSFTLAFDFDAPVERVFSFFSELTLRRRWFGVPGHSPDARHELDFRVGGYELAVGTFAAAGVAEHIEVRARFVDIVDQRRIVYVQELLLDGHCRSVSLVTIELSRQGSGTQLIYTEQYVFLLRTGDGRDDVGERRGGTRLLMNGLAAALRA
jgi:uncharacterized protein YndB with AHSA1/START domain